MANPDPILSTFNIDVRYGHILALSGIDISLFRGEAIGLLGANGAGKTTLLNALSGFLRPSTGQIKLYGHRIDREPPHVIVRRGLLHLSQERDLFTELTVLDNLKLGSITRAPKRASQNLERVFHYFPRLKERLNQRAATMSGGEQQMLAIGRALMAEPEILLFDEPSAGLSPLFVQEVCSMAKALRKESSIAIVLVEQNMRVAAEIVDRFYILRAGRMVAEGPVAELQKDHEYLAREYYL